jgi:hypothetical protein
MSWFNIPEILKNDIDIDDAHFKSLLGFIGSSVVHEISTFVKIMGPKRVYGQSRKSRFSSDDFWESLHSGKILAIENE